MKKLIFILVLSLLALCGCSKKEVIVYDFVICDKELASAAKYLKGFENENYVVNVTDFSEESLNAIIQGLDDNADGLNSVTVYSENLAEEMAVKFVEIAKDNKIPVVFAITEISDEVLQSYDKVYAINTDYTHAAEITAEKVTDYWHKNIIIDRDKNLIFSFAVIKDDKLDENMESFLDTLVADIELYGIPMQVNETVSASEIDDAEDIEKIKENNEGIIIVSNSISDYLAEYSSEGDGVEVIAVTHDVQNLFSSDFNILNCFVNYTQYKVAADKIIENYNNREYLLNDFSFPYIDKTIYIPATV